MVMCEICSKTKPPQSRLLNIGNQNILLTKENDKKDQKGVGLVSGGTTSTKSTKTICTFSHFG